MWSAIARASERRERESESENESESASESERQRFETTRRSCEGVVRWKCRLCEGT